MHYSRTACYYHWLEVLTFGTALRSARLAHLNRVSEGGVFKHALFVGEGNGSFLVPFVLRYPEVRITVVDESVEMLDIARSRLIKAGLSIERIEFLQLDVRCHAWPKQVYDFVVTHFFLDNFDDKTVEAIVASLASATTENAQWLLADFTIPERGWRRWRAKLWLCLIYAFFGCMAGVESRNLPAMETVLRLNGFVVRAHQISCGGLLSSICFRRVLS